MCVCLCVCVLVLMEITDSFYFLRAVIGFCSNEINKICNVLVTVLMRQNHSSPMTAANMDIFICDLEYHGVDCFSLKKRNLPLAPLH